VQSLLEGSQLPRWIVVLIAAVLLAIVSAVLLARRPAAQMAPPAAQSRTESEERRRFEEELARLHAEAAAVDERKRAEDAAMLTSSAQAETPTSQAALRANDADSGDHARTSGTAKASGTPTFTIIGKPYTAEELAQKKAHAERQAALDSETQVEAAGQRAAEAEQRAADAERRAAEATRRAGRAEAERDAATAAAARQAAAAEQPPPECQDTTMTCGLHQDIASWEGITLGADGKMYRIFGHDIYAPQSHVVVDHHRILIACPN
jgi:hypothetical protein